MSPRKKRRLHRKAVYKQQRTQRRMVRYAIIDRECAGFPSFVGRDTKGPIRI